MLRSSSVPPVDMTEKVPGLSLEAAQKARPP
jgi:hypothetical protein